ncbi:MAG: peptidoglycan-binding domain-containing protein [Candidatus Paceibacterota bacterium]
MNSRFIRTGKNLIVMTLIAGFLVMPIAPILAEEIVAPVDSASVVSDIISEPITNPEVIIDPVIDIDPIVIAPISVPDEATNTCPVLEFVSTSTDPLPVVDPVIVIDIIDLPDQKALTIDLVGEDSFTTPAETPVDNLTVAVSEEQDFTTLVGEIVTPDNLAISEENPFGDDIVIIDPSVSYEGQWETLPAEGDDNLVVSAENSFTTTSVPDDKNPTVSVENSFTTLDTPTEDHFTVSAEQSFNTLSIPTIDPAISAEQSFETLAIPTVDPTVSVEGNFTTLPGEDHTDPGVSDEYNFTTLSNPTEDPVISEEMSFRTLEIPDDHEFTISEENSFTTLGTPNDHDTTVSEENSFTTESGSSGCTSNCGGSGGGGGYVLAEKTYRCEILLYKFIRLGQTNDRREVMKLQAFLRVYEGFKNLRITGVYDMPTYRAVEIFQKRYSKDILGPWKISDSTGYVYITTRIAINNIFCGRDTTNNADLRDEFYREYEAASGEKFPTGSVGPAATSTDVGYFITPTTTEATSTSIVKKSWILASLGGLLGFVGDNLCWLLNLFLLLIILFLLWLLWLIDRDSESTIVAEEQDSSSVDLMGLPADKLEEDFDVFREPIVNSSLGMVGAVALEELMSPDDDLALADLAEEEDSQLLAANNDPDQEKLLTPTPIEESSEI